MCNTRWLSIIEIESRSLQRFDYKVLVVLELHFAIVVDIAQPHPSFGVLFGRVVALAPQYGISVTEQGWHFCFCDCEVLLVGVVHEDLAYDG